MIGQISVHAVDDAQIIGVPGQMRQSLGHPQSGLTVLSKFERGTEQLCSATVLTDRGGLAVGSLECGFVVQQVDV